MRVELRNDSVHIEGYVNAVGRDSRPIRDRTTGKKFIEQIVPGAFRRALNRNEVRLLLDHDDSRELGSTETNMELYEDSIGLKASVDVTDPEIMEKAKNHKLRGWSFGFRELEASEEETAAGLTRRFVEDLELVEVSLIDEKKVPCYPGTSVETRAEGKEVITSEVVETRAAYYENNEHPDLSGYHARIEKLKGVENE